MKGFIAIEYGLYQIIPRGKCRQAPRRPTKGVVIENCGMARRESLDVEAKNIRTIERFVGLNMSARLALEVAAEQQDDPAVERSAI